MPDLITEESVNLEGSLFLVNIGLLFIRTLNFCHFPTFFSKRSLNDAHLASCGARASMVLKCGNIDVSVPRLKHTQRRDHPLNPFFLYESMN